VLARRASPIDRINARTPPFLLLHGTADLTVPYEQSVWMNDALDDQRGAASFLRTYLK
jgi:dipeptidyl aminopeptidase/acylaminoacyl peptidase